MAIHERITGFVLALTGILLLILIICAVLGVMVHANIIQEKFSGENVTFDHRSDTNDESRKDVAMADNARTMNYEIKRTWEDGSDNNPEKITSSYVLTTGNPKSAYRNQWRVVTKSKSTGYGTTYQATKVTGDFSVNANTVTTDIDFDSLVIADGNATWRARIINGQSGRPITESETDAIGKLMIDSYINISKPIQTPEDWLGFCSSFGDELPPGIKLVPEKVNQPGMVKMGSNNRYLKPKS